MRVLVVDQYAVTPYQLQQHPQRFEALVAELLNTTRWVGYRRSTLVDVDATFKLPYGTLAIREGAGGMAELWKARIDSSD